MQMNMLFFSTGGTAQGGPPPPPPPPPMLHSGHIPAIRIKTEVYLKLVILLLSIVFFLRYSPNILFIKYIYWKKITECIFD